MSRTTVRKYLVAGAFPERASSKHQMSVLDPYTSYLEQRFLDGCYNASLLRREIQAQGFSGGYNVVKYWLEGRRGKPGRRSSELFRAQKNAFSEATGEVGSPAIQEPTQPPAALTNAESAILLDVPLASPRHLVWLLLRDPSSLNNQEQQMLVLQPHLQGRSVVK